MYVAGIRMAMVGYHQQLIYTLRLRHVETSRAPLSIAIEQPSNRATDEGIADEATATAQEKNQHMRYCSSSQLLSIALAFLVLAFLFLAATVASLVPSPLALPWRHLLPLLQQQQQQQQPERGARSFRTVEGNEQSRPRAVNAAPKASGQLPRLEKPRSAARQAHLCCGSLSLLSRVLLPAGLPLHQDRIQPEDPRQDALGGRGSSISISRGRGVTECRRDTRRELLEINAPGQLPGRQALPRLFLSLLTIGVPEEGGGGGGGGGAFTALFGMYPAASNTELPRMPLGSKIDKCRPA